MTNSKIHNHNGLPIALCVFANCLLIQTNYVAFVPVVILFINLLLFFTCGMKTTLVNFVITCLFLLWTKVNFCFYDYKWMKQFYPLAWLRWKISNFYDHLYWNQPFVSSIFKLVFLNMKSVDARWTYRILTEISIIHIFIISGFHLNFLFFLLTFWNKRKHYLLVDVLAFSICLFYGLLLNLTFGILRSLITLFLGKVQRFKRFNSQQKLTIATLLIIFLNTESVQNFGFQMSCLGTFGCINSARTGNKILDNLCANVFAGFLIAPIVLIINHRFNLISFAVSLFFAPIFYAFIVYVWFFSWIAPLITVNVFLVNLFSHFISLIGKMEVLLRIYEINPIYVIAYYWLVLTTFMLINLKSNSSSRFNGASHLIWS